MDVICERCDTEYEFDETLLSGRGTSVKCTNCGHVFKVYPKAQADEDRATSTWRLKLEDDSIDMIDSLRELQRRIASGELTPENQIARGDENWKPLGSIPELETFFEAAGVSIVDGRSFDSGDNQDAADVIIVSQAFADRFWPGESAIGRVVRSARTDEEMTIVGVASDTKVRTLGEAPRPFVYAALEQNDIPFLTLVAATRGAPGSTANGLMAGLRARVPEALVYTAQTMDDHLETVRFPSRIAAVMFTFFAVIALALATIGLYGLVSYTQAQRTHEVGIRMSLGADARSVVSLLIRGGMRLVWVGIGVGVVLAFGVTRILAGLLFGVGATDIGTFVGVVLLLSGIALAAAWVPARRASRVDPVQALRAE